MNFSKNYIISFPLYGLCILGINKLLKFAVNFTCEALRFTDVTSEAKAKMILVYIVLYINISMPLAIINFDFTS
jgi:hypothetical protein